MDFPVSSLSLSPSIIQLIRNLVELMPEEALLARGSNDYTALHHIAKNNYVEAAKILVTKNPLFIQILNNYNETPLLLAARLRCKKMVRYLVTVTKDEASGGYSPFRGENGITLLYYIINLDLYDVALDLVEKYEGIATGTISYGRSAISALAKKSWTDSAMSAGVTISRANNIMYKQYLELTECICNRIRLLDTITMNDLLEGVLLEASKQGCVNFLKSIINIDSGQILLTDERNNSILHIASSSMVVATLIATVVFAAAFTVPGGTRSDVGLPFFLNKMPYLVFAVSNAMALFFSLTSVLIFLSILTSTYGIEDFLVSLPRRLIIGETMLFFAIATMITAFGASYFIMLGHKLAWLSILIAFFICLSVILFVILQARLFLL